MAEHPNRKFIRLQEYDYSSQGAYFLTFCTSQRRCFLSEISEGGEVLLLDAGKIAQEMIENTNVVRDDVSIDSFVIMPNHVHLLLFIHDSPTTETYNKFRKPKASSASSVIGNIKSYSTREIRRIPEFANATVWQSRFNDHVIRDERDLQTHRQYILDNPGQWLEDAENPINWKKRLSVRKG